MESLFNIKPVGIKYVCDTCKVGEMLPTGNMIMLETSVLYSHRCNNCESEIELNKKYPLINYEFIPM